MKDRIVCSIVAAVLALSISVICNAANATRQESVTSHHQFGHLPRHVFIVVLENEGFETTFGGHSPARYLSQQLVPKGLLLTQYYGIGHFSLDNYVAMVSGQGPNSYTQNDCFTYYDFRPLTAALDTDGQALGAGCVYPTTVLTIADQLEAAHLTWKGYMEDMDQNCEHPALGQPDNHIKASKDSQYATRHDPFVYFHSIIDHETCANHVVPLATIGADLSTVATTPNLSFITPNLCHDGHDKASGLCAGGHLLAADQFLSDLVPKILNAPAYQRDGMLIITFDEADIEIKDGVVMPNGTDSASCCDEPTGPNTVAPGRTGPGGGRTGTLIISPFVHPGLDDQPYNHYSLLRSLEDMFSVNHLGFAARPSLRSFGDDVYDTANRHISSGARHN